MARATLKRQVAIKTLPSSLAADFDRLARFQREAEILASLDCTHLTAPGTRLAGGASDVSSSPTITALARTEAGVILGTAAYMSPEPRGRPVDKRADIRAFECVLFEMLTGKAAFCHRRRFGRRRFAK